MEAVAKKIKWLMLLNLATLFVAIYSIVHAQKPYISTTYVTRNIITEPSSKDTPPPQELATYTPRQKIVKPPEANTNPPNVQPVNEPGRQSMVVAQKPSCYQSSMYQGDSLWTSYTEPDCEATDG